MRVCGIERVAKSPRLSGRPSYSSPGMTSEGHHQASLMLREVGAERHRHAQPVALVRRRAVGVGERAAEELRGRASGPTRSRRDARTTPLPRADEDLLAVLSPRGHRRRGLPRPPAPAPACSSMRLDAPVEQRLEQPARERAAVADEALGVTLAEELERELQGLREHAPVGRLGRPTSPSSRRRGCGAASSSTRRARSSRRGPDRASARRSSRPRTRGGSRGSGRAP